MSKNRKRSRIACLNCYEVDDKFLEALGEIDPAQNDKYEIGLIFNKRKLKLGDRFKVEDVELKRGWEEPVPLSECHRYDNPKYRMPLKPFNFCRVVRIVIPKSAPHKKAVVALPSHVIMAILVKDSDYNWIVKCLESKRMNHIKVFSLL